MNILLIDDHTLFRQSLRRMLEVEAEWAVVGSYGKLDDAIGAVENGLSFDLALIDYELEEADHRSKNGLTAATQLRSMRPSIPILMVTAGMASKDILHAVQEAKVGIFLKNETAEELFLAMRHTVRGEPWVSSAVALSLVQRSTSLPSVPEALFSIRERKVLRFVLEGLTNKEIAKELDLSESLVKAILQKLFEKSGVRSRSQLVRVALETQSYMD